MKRLFKQVVSLALASLTLAGTAVFAQDEMTNAVFAGYDTNNLLNPNYIYNVKVGDGWGDEQIYVRVDDNDIKWVFGGYEAVYPYAGFSVMNIKNPVTGEFESTGVTAYNNITPQWETRRVDATFEIIRPYTIVERQQTNVPGKGWTWDFGNSTFGIPDTALIHQTKRNAKVTNEWNNKGFAQYDNAGVKLDVYRTIGDYHCELDATFNPYCTACADLLPIEYWSKEDAEAWATQTYFNVLNDAVLGEIDVDTDGDGVADAAAYPVTTSDLTWLIDKVCEVRAINKHIDNCPSDRNEKVQCMHHFHPQVQNDKGEWVSVRPTIANELKKKFGIEGWNEVVTYLLTNANLSAKGNIVQNTAKYPRDIYGNLLTNEGKNRFYLSDDILQELIPTIESRTISAVLNGQTITQDVVAKYIESEIAYHTALNIAQGKEPVEWIEWNTPAELEANRTYIISKRIDYIRALTDMATSWQWIKYDSANTNAKYTFNPDWALAVDFDAEIEWTSLNYEAKAPYAHYQYMIVNDIVLNGVDGRPTVYRYTGSNADPKVEWKQLPMSDWYPVKYNSGNDRAVYAPLEQKYIDGVAVDTAIDADAIRMPAVYFNILTPWGDDWQITNELDKYAFSYIESNDKYTDYYITDNAGTDIHVLRLVNYGTLGKNNVNPNNDKINGGFAYIGAPVIGAY